MKVFTSKLSQTLVATVAAGAMAVTTASPAFARDRDGIGAGEVIAGALIIGGIAAIAAAASNNNRDRYGYGYGHDYRYDRAGFSGFGSRQAVEACVNTARRDASRWSRGRADVTQVTRINRVNNGYNVRGRIAVDNRGYGWNRGGYDTGSFNCKVRHGRIADLSFSGIRGLR